MKKSTATPKIAVLSIFLAIAISFLAIPQATSSENQNVTELELEMAHLQNILAQMDNGTLERSYNIVAISAENYSCNSTGYEISKVMTSGKHHLMFQFGDDVDYANNMAGCTLSCDSTTADTCIISTARGVLTDCYIDDGVIGKANIEIQSGGSIYNNSNNASFAINVTGNITIKNGGNITGNVNITAVNLTIDSGGKIYANGNGYAGGTGTLAGLGPGGGGSTSAGTGSAGSYYGNLSSPIDFGSGGGGGNGGTSGGNGGGYISLNITDTLTNNGILSANGTNGGSNGCCWKGGGGGYGGNGGGGTAYGAGGGSGGGINIITGTFSGSGTISANGGAGGGGTGGGGGSGGRITARYTSKTYTGTLVANGNSGGVYGGAGTIYLENKSSGYKELILDNNNNAGAQTPINETITLDNLTIQRSADVVINSGTTVTTLNSGSWTFSGLSVNGTFNASSVTNLTVGGTFTITNPTTTILSSLKNLTINNGGTLKHQANYDSKVYYINLSLENIIINSGGKIDVSGKGYAGVSGANGLGPGGGTYWATTGAGAGYGGNGGGSNTGGRGAYYGSPLIPNDLGSAGGGGSSSTGGAGGGLVILNVINLTVNGNIAADSILGSGTYYGGGAGGGIYINTSVFSGTGSVTANGTRGNNDPFTGGGSGGRIAIYYSSKTYTGSFSAYGGSGTYGGAGTIYFENMTAGYKELVLDNNNNAGAKTPINETITLNNLTIQKSADVVINSGKTVTANNSGTWNISTPLTINGTLKITDTTNLIIVSGSTITVNGIFNASSVTNLTISGTFSVSNDTTTILSSLKNITINNAGILTHLANSNAKVYYINMTLENLWINSGGMIDVSGKGYSGGSGTANGNGPGGGVGNGRGGGGGYGGKGGSILPAQGGGRAGSSYGNITDPNDLGSGGGSYSSGNGGAGGGFVKLNVSGTLSHNGSIIATGGSGSSVYNGGGSGGAIYISSGTLSGNGTVTANGGNAGGATDPGAGGGGIIAIYYSGTLFGGTITAYGGTTGYEKGGAGTIYLKSSSQTYGDLTIDNNGNAGANTPFNSSAYTTPFNTIIVRNAAIISSLISPLTLNVTTLTGNGTISLGTNSTSIRTSNISMSGGSITSTTGQINITFTSSINTSNFIGNISTTSGAIRIFYGSIGLSTGFTAQSTIARTFTSWSNQQIKWNDTNQSGAVTANYNLTGLLANTQYLVYNTSIGSTTNSYSLTTDSNGALNFAITLNGNTEINLATQNYALCSGLCDVGSGGNTCLIGSAKSTYAGCLIDNSVLDGYSSILINGTGSIYNNTNNAIFAINITGNITIKNGGNITGNVNISAVNLTVESGGSIDASGKGYINDTGPGAGTYYNGFGNRGGFGGGLIILNISGTLTNNGFIWANGTGGVTGSFGASGGGYGSRGGRGNAATGGPAYGSIISPNDFGSGGGSGTSGSRCSAGGSGGGIYIDAGTFAGNGIVSADGGAPGSQSAQGGGGGGGRIAIYYNTKTFSGNINVNGGLNSYASYTYSGGAGTIYIKQSGQNGELIIHNIVYPSYDTLDRHPNTTISETLALKNLSLMNVYALIASGKTVTAENSGSWAVPSNTTLIVNGDFAISSVNNLDVNGTLALNNNPGRAYSFAALTVPSGANLTIGQGNSITTANSGSWTIGGDLAVYGALNASSVDNLTIKDTFSITNSTTTVLSSLKNLTINSGGKLTHAANINGTKTYYINLSLENLVIDYGGLIDVAGLGYSGGPPSGTGYGPGGGSSSKGGAYGGGGGYATGTVLVYGSLTAPTDLGSGGGGDSPSWGGAGGSMVLINVSGTITLNGLILANGSTGTSTKGTGGSGGSVYINVNTFAGNGGIYAQGGNSYTGALGARGGGGGGRIAVYYNTKTFSGTIADYGGAGWSNPSPGYYGGAGTIYLKNNSNTYGDLTIDNNGNAGAVTQLNSSTYSTAFDTMDVSDAAIVTSALSTLPLNVTKLIGNGNLSFSTNNLTLRVSNISMSGGSITSTTGQINITFISSINASNFVGTVSTSSGVIRIWYGSSPSDRCDVSGATISGATPTYYYAPWSNTTAYRCVRSIVIDNYNIIDATNTTRTQLNVNEAFYQSVRIREYDGSSYYDVAGNWNMTTYNSNGSVSNSTLLMTNASGSYIWRNASSSESTPASYSFYANITGVSGVGMTNSTLANRYSYSVKGLNITYQINDSAIYASEGPVLINGTVYLEPEHVVSGTTQINITLNSGSSDAGGKITDASGRYNFTYTPAAVTSVTTINFTLNATDSGGINGTTTNSSAITIYPAISVDTWTSTTSTCFDRTTDFNNTGAIFLCANVTYGSVHGEGGESARFTVYKTGVNNEMSQNPVFNVTSTVIVNFTPAGESQALWQYRKAIIINGSTSELTTYQTNFTINWASGMNSTFQDLRFAYYNTATLAETQIPYWIESYTASTNANVWIKTNLTTGNNTVYMYYGNPSAANQSNQTNVFGNWIKGYCGIYVYNSDLGGTYQWKTSNTDCVSPQCSTSSTILEANNSVDFSEYPARNACKSIAGRLPTRSELECIDTNRASLGTFQSNYYHSGQEQSANAVYRVLFPGGGTYWGTNTKTNSNYVRCVLSASPEPSTLSVGNQETKAVIAYTNVTLNESSAYILNVTAWNSNINPSVTAIDNFTFEFGQLNVSSADYDSTIYATENSTISGLLRDFMNVSWFNNATTTFVNITSTSGTFNANYSLINSTGGFNFTYTPNSSLTAKTTVTLNINATYGNITGNWTGTLDVYPQMAVDTWASSSSSCASRDSALNITTQKYLCANVTYGTGKIAGAYVNFSVSDIGAYSYGAANPVFANNSIYDGGTIVSSPIPLNEAIKYRITATVWNPTVNAAVMAQDSYDFIYGVLNITAALNDTIVMPDVIIGLTGKIFDYHNMSWIRQNNSLNVYLDENLLTTGGFYNRTWTSSADFSNGTETNTTSDNGNLILDPRGEFYFEAENYLSKSAGFTQQNNGAQPWDGNPSGNKYMTGGLNAWINYNITNIPNGTYYVFLKMLAESPDNELNVSWDNNFIGFANFTYSSSSINWSSQVLIPVVVNSSSHILGINSSVNGPAVDVILLTTNASFAPDNTDQNYTSTQLKYSGYFVSNKTTANYAVISFTPSWTSNEPAGSNVTIDVSANNGASWCTNVVKSAEYRGGCGGIGSGSELVFRANLSTSNPFAALRLEDLLLNYGTGNATKTNSTGNYSFAFNGGKALGWHTVKVNSSDIYGIYGNMNTTYYVDNLTIITDTTPNVVDVDSLSETLTVTVNSNAGRTTGRRYNITATVLNPDSTQDIISNSSFTCSLNYPMTCTAAWTPGVQPLGFYNVTVLFVDNESINGQNTTYSDFKVDNVTMTLNYVPAIPILSTQNITVSGLANYSYDGSAVQNNIVALWTDNVQITKSSWWNTSWQYRKEITINGSTTNLSDYQVLVNLTSSNFNFSRANAQGNDTRFTWLNTTSGLEQNIAFWIENWTSSGANGNATLWVKVPNLTASSVANTTLYMYYGNPSSTPASNVTNTFIRIVSGVIGAWDLNGDAKDRSGNGNDGTLYGGMSYTTGPFGQAGRFQGTDDYIGLGNPAILRPAANFSISVWYQTSGVYGYMVGQSDGGADDGYELWFSTDRVKWTVDGGASGADFLEASASNNSIFQNVISTFQQNTNASIYKNGSLSATDGTVTSNDYAGVTGTNIGASTVNTLYFIGNMSNIRIYNISLSASEAYDIATNFGYVTTNYPGKELIRKYTSPMPSVFSFGAEQTTTTTNSTGRYNYTSAAIAQIGTHTLKVNLTDTNGVSGENSTQIEVWAPTKVNGTATDYVLDIDDGMFNVTGYYWRTDVLSAIIGEINITINSITKTCASATSCQKTFYLGPGQDISSTGIYTVRINASNNSAYYMTNSTQFNIVVENITTTLYTNKSLYLVGESILINGTAQQSVLGLMPAGQINATIDGNSCGTPAWTGAGKWNTSCAINSGTYSTNLGPAMVFANITNQTDWIYGQNSTMIEIWAPTKVNGTASDYVVDIDEGALDVTGYYWRTDVLSLINGEINITINGTTKTCASATTCQKTFYLGPGQDIVSTGVYNVTIIATNNSFYYMQNSTAFSVTIENITTTVATDKYLYLVGENVTIDGTARQTVRGLLTSGTLEMTIDGNICGTPAWRGSGYWNTSCALNPGTFSGNLGPATILANVTNQTDWIYGENTTTIEIWTQTMVNHSTTTSYDLGANTEYNVTGNYFRTDSGSDIAILGLINITIFNSTYSISKTCAGSSSCLKTFTLGPTGELTGGNYTVYVNASNDGSYYMENSTQYSAHIEEPKAGGTLVADYIPIADMTYGVDYTYVDTITLNNSYKAKMRTPYISEVIDYGLCVKIKSVENITSKNCQDIPTDSICSVQFNITIAGDACVTPPCDIECLDWNSNWTENDNTVGSASNNGQIIHISGNPAISAGISLINITDNIGQSNITNVAVDNSGNEVLGSGSAGEDVNVDFVSGNMPPSWIRFYSSTNWFPGDYWDYINIGNGYTLQVNVTPQTYLAGTYTGIINITAIKGSKTQAYDEINVSVTISPQMALSQNMINVSENIGTSNITNITVQSTGNSPVTNVSVSYIYETMPSSWISFSSPDTRWNLSSNSFERINEYTGKTLEVNITAKNYIAGTYTGKINVTTNENIYRVINVSVTVLPRINITAGKINITGNISSLNLTAATIRSIGNAPLTNVTIALVNSTIPESWLNISSPASDWDGTSRSFQKIMEATNRTLNITIKATNYTEGTYTGILNVTTNENENTQTNLSITIIPQATSYDLSRAEEHGRTVEWYFTINSTGNAPLINATATYVESTLPASWIALKYAAQNSLTIYAGNATEGTYKNITVEITIPEFQNPGIYAGYINTTFDNEPSQLKTLTLTVNTNSSWHIDPPANRSNVFLLSQPGVIGNVTVVNTGNIPLNYTVVYTPTCSYGCMSGAPAQYNPTYIFVAKNSSETFSVWQAGDGNSATNQKIMVNVSNSSGTPASTLAYMFWNITNAPPSLINLTTTPKNYVEMNKSLTLFAVVSDDELNTTTKGLNLSSVYFNVTDPSGYVYSIDNYSISWWDSNDEVPPELDRKKFSYLFLNTSVAGIHNLTVYIKDKSGNEINRTIFQFEVIGATSFNITASAPPTASNVTLYHGENLTVPVNITNSGRGNAYNVTVTGTFGGGAGSWTVWNRTYATLNESEKIETNVTITVSKGATAGSAYQFTPKVMWTQPNLTLQENSTSTALTVTVAQNPEITTPSELLTSINHGEKKSVQFYVNSTGNYNYYNSFFSFIAGTAGVSWLCFNNYCSNFGDPTLAINPLTKNYNYTVELYLDVARGTVPGNYTSRVNISSANYDSSRYRVVNLTITVLEDRSWMSARPYNRSSFDLNTAGTAGIITINNTGNIDTNFTISYSNWSDTDYHAYPGIFNESINISGTIVNPGSIVVGPNEVKNITLYQNGYYQGKENVGINVTVYNSSATPAQRSFEIAFNLTEAAPEITSIVFFNGSGSSLVELNKTIGIKVVAVDDAALNISAAWINITGPTGSSTIAYPGATSENESAYSEYVKMNFTYLFNSTAASGTYQAKAFISDKFGGFSVNSSTYTFNVIGATNLNLIHGNTTSSITGISQTLSRNVTIPINVTNTGTVTAYNLTLGGTLSSNASAWTIYDKSLGNISSSALLMDNITLYVPNATWPGTYYFTPKIIWRQPNGTVSEYSSNPVSVLIASNKTVIFETYYPDFTIQHGQTNSSTIKISAVGNDNATNVWFLIQNTPGNFTVSLNESDITSIAAGQSKYVTLDIIPALGKANGSYAFNIALYNNVILEKVYDFAVTVPANFSWTVNADKININGVSGQNAIDESVIVQNTGNVPMDYTFTLSGYISPTGGGKFASIVDGSASIQAQETYTIRINHTAPQVTQTFYNNILRAFNETVYWKEVNITYYSYEAGMNITSISPNNNIISGDAVNVTTLFKFGMSNITENTTYAIAINGTICGILQETALDGYVIHTCTAPGVADGRYHDMRVTADYNWSTGIVTLVKMNSSAVYYKDVTSPKVLAHNITSEQEILKNVTVNLTLEDNVQISSVVAEIIFPNTTAYGNVTLSNATLANYSRTFSAPSTIGMYTARYYVFDTTGNVNSSITDTFEVYEWKNFSGTITDLNSNPITVMFNVTDPSTRATIASFTTNASGYFNATIKRKTYDLEMNFLDATVLIENIDFATLPLDFIDIDRPLTGDYGFQGNVIKGFAVNTSLSGSGNITITYTGGEASGFTTDYFQIYKCANWDYSQRNCNSGLTKLTSIHDKINRKLKASFSGFSAYIIVEDTPASNPEMTITTTQLPITAGHGNKSTALLTIQSTGSVSLTNIQFSCTQGTACTDFTVAANSIIGLDAGASYDAPVNVTVPKYYAPGTYDGKLVITSNQQSIYAQYDEVTLKVTVPEDNNWTYTSNLTLQGAGGGINGTLGSISLRNYANVPISFTIAPNTTDLSASPEEITIAKNNTDTVMIYYSTPDISGVYNYAINASGDGRASSIPATVNVTHAVNITNIEPSAEITVGQIININATAEYLGVVQDENVTWNAYVDETPCENVSYNYNLTVWNIYCEAPNMSAKLSYTLKLKGTFVGYDDSVAYDYSYDVQNIYYVDAIPPIVVNQTTGIGKTSMNATVNVTLSDYSNITEAFVTIIAPNGTVLDTLNLTMITDERYSFAYNFTNTGDYILRYSAEDSLNNSGITDEYFEVYKNITMSGKVEKSDSSGIQTTFSLYRENQSFSAAHLIHHFTTDGNGVYSENVHDRLYDVKFDVSGNIVKLYNVNISEYNNDPIDIDIVLGNEVQISGVEEFGGIAVETAINTSSGRVTISYVPDSDTKEDNIYIYRCADWNFTEVECNAEWTRLDRKAGDLDKINNRISADIAGFSAYVAAEITPPIIVDIQQQGLSSGGGGGGGSTAGIAKSIEEIKEKMTELPGIKERIDSLLGGTSDFSVDAKSISKDLYPGEHASYALGVKNSRNATTRMSASLIGEVSDFISFDMKEIILSPMESGAFSINVDVPNAALPGIYEGKIILKNDNNSEYSVPVSIRVLDAKNLPISIDAQPLTDEILPGESVRVKLNIYNTGSYPMPVNYTIAVIDPVTGAVVSEIYGSKTVDSSESSYINVTVPDNVTLDNPTLNGFNNVRTKRLMIKATATYNSQGHDITADSMSFISVTESVSILNLSIFGVQLWMIFAAFAFATALYFARKQYLVWSSSKKKFIESIDFKTLPQPGLRSGFIGKIAETDIRAFMDLDTLQTHTVVAGSTGGGKTVAAQGIVEEALCKEAAVIVFDPTAQWSGFLRPNRNKKMLKMYRDFEMKVAQSRAFDGNIYEVRDARTIIDIKRYMNPGEITIFTMNHMDPEDIDFFIANTVKQVFHANLDESQKLKLLIVYDEVHRLLERYGGSGDGLIQIERAAREFRKWGVGLVLISQVLSDFVGTIKANIGTDIQMRTRDENDLERIRMKYGEDMMRSVVKAAVGEGMIENSAYNKGKPYFVAFKPLLHAIERLPDAELEMYSKYNARIDDIRYQLESLKTETVDVFDLELELKLALDKLKKGKFRMVDIYLEEIEPKVIAMFKKIGREPTKRVVEYIERNEIRQDIERAKKEREIYIKKQKLEEEKMKRENASKADAPDLKEKAETRGAERHAEKNVKEMKAQKTVNMEKHTREAAKDTLQKTVHAKAAEKASSESDLEKKEREVNEMYNELKAKISESNRKGADTSIVNLEAMSIPADIKLAMAEGSVEGLEKLKRKVNGLLAKL